MLETSNLPPVLHLISVVAAATTSAAKPVPEQVPKFTITNLK